MTIDTQYMDNVASTKEMLMTPAPRYQKPLNVAIYKDAIILPYHHVDTLNGMGGGIITKDNQHISVLDIGESRYNVNTSDIFEANKSVIYIGLLNHKWGHCITDNIKKLWYLFTPEYQTAKDKMDIVYTYNEGDPIKGNFKEMLSMLGVALDRCYAIIQPTIFKEVIVPDDSMIYGGKEYELQNCQTCRYWTTPFKNLFDRIPRISSNKKWDKVYVSRRKWDGADFGEKDIERLFKYVGFQVIYPETMSFTEQLAVYQNCKCLASTEGSISHNSLFMKDGAELIIIRKADLLNTYQLMINDMKNLHCTYIDCHLSIFNDKKYPYVGPFFLYVNNNLQRWAWTRMKEKCFLNTFRYENFCRYAQSAYVGDMDNRCEGDMFYYQRLKHEILNEHRHKYYKFANKLFPRMFPWRD